MNDKEKYNAALERAAKLRVQNPFDTVGQMVEHIFPELKESEDERIKKMLIRHIRQERGSLSNNETQMIINWLEKQGGQKPAWREEDESWFKELELMALSFSNDVSYRKEFFDWLKSVKDRVQHKVEWNEEDEKIKKELITHFRNTRCTTEKGAKKIVKWIAWLEKQGEQPTDKAETKFKEGDYIVPNDITFSEIWRVVNIDKDDYYNIQCITNPEYDELYRIPGFVLEKDYRLWTVQDADDGDVLVASDGSIFLFAGVDDCACKYYAALTTDNYVKINKEPKGGYWETSRAVYPATEEQRELLFKIIKEAGYEWNNEKKEFNKQTKKD